MTYRCRKIHLAADRRWLRSAPDSGLGRTHSRARGGWYRRLRAHLRWSTDRRFRRNWRWRFRLRSERRLGGSRARGSRCRRGTVVGRIDRRRGALPRRSRAVPCRHPREDGHRLRVRIGRNGLEPPNLRCRRGGGSRRSWTLGCWCGRRWRRRGWRSGGGLWLGRDQLQVVVWCPALFAAHLNEPPAVVVFLDQLNDVILLQCHLAFLALECELRLVHFHIRFRWWGRRRVIATWRRRRGAGSGSRFCRGCCCDCCCNWRFGRWRNGCLSGQWLRCRLRPRSSWFLVNV